MNITQDYFDGIIQDLWKELPNGQIYTAIAKGELPERILKTLAELEHNEDYSQTYLKHVLSLLQLKEVSVEDFRFIDNVYSDDIIKYIAELAMSLIAVHKGGVDNGLCQALARKLVAKIEQCPHEEHYKALRELSDVLFLFYSLPDNINPGLQDYYRRVCTTTTTQNMTHWPNLVGAAVVRYGDWLSSQDDTSGAESMYQNVILDLEYIVERIDDPDLPQAEKMIALWWLKEACWKKLKINPLDQALNEQHRSLETLLQGRDCTEVPLMPRLGQIVCLYQSEQTFLTSIIQNIMALQEFNDGTVRDVVHKYGVTTYEVSFYFSAIESYSAKGFFESSGVNMDYDDDHEKVFAAIELLSDKQ